MMTIWTGNASLTLFLKDCNFGVKRRKYIRLNLSRIPQIQLILHFWIPNAHFYLKQKKEGKVRTWEDSQIFVLLISIRTFCSSSINLGNNWCRIQFVLIALSHFNLLKHNNLYHLNDLLFFFLLSYWPVDDRAHNPDEMKW